MDEFLLLLLNKKQKNWPFEIGGKSMNDTGQ